PAFGHPSSPPWLRRGRGGWFKWDVSPFVKGDSDNPIIIFPLKKGGRGVVIKERRRGRCGRSGCVG
ncbi:MAG: hypothetical protein KKC21_01300, partial [Nitrospinae bacterium]|nr:hypothetical protein [Nitrospinota bacterium]